LIELLAFLRRAEFPNDHPFGRILVTPDMPGSPEVWLLGSSGWSADAAGQLGLSYAAAHFINPMTTRRSVEHYRQTWQAGGHAGAPRVIVAVGAIAAATEEEAQRLAASQRLRRILRDRGEWDNGPIPTPEDAIARIGEAAPPPEASEWPRIFTGSVEQVHASLDAMAKALEVDELMLVTVVHSHQARRDSYRLLAQAFGLKPPVSAEKQRRR
jgi:luciferase family oxidoreductase group 1